MSASLFSKDSSPNKSLFSAYQDTVNERIRNYGTAVSIGVLGRYIFTTQGIEPDTVLGNGAQNVLSELVEFTFPPLIVGLYVAAVLSAIMSTVSAQILVAASAVAHDIYTKMLKQSLSHEKIIFVSRLTVLFLGLGAMFIALGETRVIFWFVLFAWSGLGASFGPLILFSLYWKRVTRDGAIAGMLTGFITTLIWKITGLSDSLIYELVPAFIFSSGAIYFVSKKRIELF